MGKNLAHEVNSFIIKWCPGNSLGRISFITHSLGGLIARASLPYLDEYQDKMYTYISFGTPHLGYLLSKHILVNIGMWFLKVWKNSLCLRQFEMRDAANLEDTFLYRLSKMPGLGWF